MDEIVEQVIKRSMDKLQYEKGSPFTIEGYDALKVEISTYINELIGESYRVTKRNKSDLISKSNIETASFNLIKKHSNNVKQYFTSIGGFLFGLSVTITFEMLANNQSLNNSSILLVLVCGIIGSFILGITFFKTS